MSVISNILYFMTICGILFETLTYIAVSSLSSFVNTHYQLASVLWLPILCILRKIELEIVRDLDISKWDWHHLEHQPINYRTPIESKILCNHAHWECSGWLLRIHRVVDDFYVSQILYSPSHQKKSEMWKLKISLRVSLCY